MDMLQSLGQQLQSIHGQLEGQNQRWQATESKIEKQNIRMTNMETQVGQITTYKQTLIQTATKVETLSDEMKSVHVKMREYDKSIQGYSDMCDDITASNSQTDSQIESLIQKVNTLDQCQNVLETKQCDTEEKLIDVQWRTMRENLVFSGIPESDVQRGEQEDWEALIKEFLKSEMNITTQIQFDRVQRLEKFKANQRYPRPIIAKFTNYKEKEHVRRKAPNTLIGTPFGVNEHYPTKIEQRRKLLYPEAKRARQNKNNEVKLVKDKLFINGRQFIPDTTNTQPRNNTNNNAQNRVNSYGHMQKHRGFQIGQRFISRPQSNFQHNDDGQRRQQQPQQDQYRQSPQWQQQRIGNQRNVSTDKLTWLNARKFVSKQAKEILISNPYGPLADMPTNNTPLRFGKQKASSPVDTDVSMKKQKDSDLESVVDLLGENTGFTNEPATLDSVATGYVNDGDIMETSADILTFQDSNDTASSRTSRSEPGQIKMPPPVDSENLYYGPVGLHGQNNSVGWCRYT